MKTKKLYVLAKKILFPELEPIGFDEKLGDYVRELESGVIHKMGICQDKYSNDTFAVMCGVDAIQMLICGNKFKAGYIKHDTHLTSKGWYRSSGHWPCKDEAEATESLLKIKEMLSTLALPWFDEHQTLSSVANEITDGAQGIYKAKLYLLDGDKEKAEQTIRTYLDWINARRTYYVDPKWREERNTEALAFMEEIKAFTK